jgi:O-acetyl-ADP-ribose deacetylase (regulator of RNase III)
MLQNLWLVHPNAEMAYAFRFRFGGLPGVRVFECRFEDLPKHDCFVTAGNAYGLMTAGIDAAVVAAFGDGIMQAVQQKVMEDYLGEQPIGTAFILPTGDDWCSYLCHAPTMRTPGSIEGTDRIYCATWASLLAIHRYNQASVEPIKTVAFPAMGTGFGAVPYEEAARQMAAAYRHYLDRPTRFDWDFVAKRQLAICYDGKHQVAR